MEIVLGSLVDWLHKALKNHPVLKWCLIGFTFAFGFWLAYVEWVN